MVTRVNAPASEAPADAPAPADTTTTPAPAATSTPAPEATPPATEATPPAPEGEPQSPQGLQIKDAPEEALSLETVESQFEAAGVSLDKYVASYAENGELTADDYAELKGKGFSKGYVDSFIAGQNALRVQEETAVFDTVGGKDAYSKITTWAKANIPAAEIEAYNEALDTMPLNTIKLVVAGLKARFEASNGSEPALVGGAPSGAAAGFQSISQVTEAMRDPRYKRDPAFRAEVESRLATSNVF